MEVNVEQDLERLSHLFPKGWQASELVSPVLKGNRKLKDAKAMSKNKLLI